MDKVRSVNGIPIRLTAERWMHITMGHPEIASHYIEVLRTVESPEIVYEGSRNELLAVRSVSDSGNKKVIVVYKELNTDDGFIVTAYLSNKLGELQKRAIVWQLPN